MGVNIMELCKASLAWERLCYIRSAVGDQAESAGKEPTGVLPTMTIPCHLEDMDLLPYTCRCNLSDVIISPFIIG